MAVTQTAEKEVIPDVGSLFSLDENVVKGLYISLVGPMYSNAAQVLPKGSKVIECISFRTAVWTRASRVVIKLSDGTRKSYFLKCATEETGRRMIEGEHRSMTEIYSYMPEFVPQPITWGRFQQASPETYFFLMEFLEIAPEVVDPPEFCGAVARLHSMSTSPNRKFGFHQVTFQGPNPQVTTWEENWCTYFTRLLTDWLDKEVSLNGPQPEYEAMYKEFVKEVIPQILEPLQADGRSLKPCLIHGDLWEENTGLNLETGGPVIFDAAAMYAHNEMELGMWRYDHPRFGEPYFGQYLKLMPPSEPVEQFDDRNRLYSMKYTLSHCQGLRDTSQRSRELLMEDMRFLSDKYATKH